MNTTRRAAVTAGLSLATGVAAGMVPAAHAEAQPSGLDPTHVLRHYVFATRNIDEMRGVMAQLKDKAGLHCKEPKYMPELGFSTSMAMVGKTTLELVAPDKVGSRPKVDEFIARRGDAGIYKLVLQTFDAAALRKRIYANKLVLERDEQFRGQEMIALDPTFFGTSLEIYQYTPLDKWWGNDGSYKYIQSELVDEIVACDVVMDNPGLTATFVAQLFKAELNPEKMSVTFQPNRTLPFDARVMRFAAPKDHKRGLVALDLKVKDRARVGETFTIHSTSFRFV